MPRHQQPLGEPPSGDDEQDGNPPRVEGSQGHQRKRKRRELEEALDVAEREVFEAGEEIENLKQRLHNQDAEIEHLRAIQAPARGQGAATSQQRSQSASTIATAHSHSESDKKAVRAAGRRCCALHTPWMQGDSLFNTEVRNNFESIISDLEATRRARSDADSDSEHEDPVDEFWRSPRFEVASPVDIVREVMSHMDLPLAKRWFEPWFITEFRNGMRKMRSEVVSEIADKRHIVFGLTDEDFGERNNTRKRGPGAKALLEGDSFMWAKEDPDDPKSLSERFMCSDVLLNAVKLLMLSPSSVRSEKRSAQAGVPRTEMWHVKTITPSILSFVSIAVRFVLSGDLVFDKVTTTANYMDAYTANLRLLKAHRTKQRRAFNSLIELYNKALFPNLYPTEGPVTSEFIGMTPAQQEFYLMLMDPQAGEEGEGSGGSGE